MDHDQPLRSFLPTLIWKRKLINLEGFKFRFFFSTTNLSAEGRGHKGAQSFAKIHSPTALKARLITAMGATHGIKVP